MLSLLLIVILSFSREISRGLVLCTYLEVSNNFLSKNKNPLVVVSVAIYLWHSFFHFHHFIVVIICPEISSFPRLTSSQYYISSPPLIAFFPSTFVQLVRQISAFFLFHSLFTLQSPLHSQATCTWFHFHFKTMFWYENDHPPEYFSAVSKIILHITSPFMYTGHVDAGLVTGSWLQKILQMKDNKGKKVYGQ